MRGSTSADPLRPHVTMESLEPRLLLDANWAGQWYFTGYDVTSDEFTGQVLEMEAWSTTFRINEQAGGGYRLVAGGRGPLRHTLTERGDILGHDHDGGDLDGGSSYVQDGSRILPITDDVALFIYTQGKYASPDMWDFWDSTASVGLMTRQAIQPTQMPWEGDYDLMEIVAECETQHSDMPGLSFHINDFAISVTDAGGGTYEVRRAGEPGSGPVKVLTESGNALVEHDIEQTDNYREEKSFTFRGPDGMLYHLGAYTRWSPERNDIWLTEFYAATLQSQNYQAPAPDLTAEVFDDVLPASLLAGDRMLVPVTVTNEGNETAIARGGIDLYLSADDQLDGNDALIASADNLPLIFRPGQSRTYRFRGSIPEGMATGNYHILADIDSGDDLAESDETNNLAVGAATVRVAEAERDLSAEIVSPRMPASVVSGDGARIVLPVMITNNGNVPIERGQRIDIGFYARPVGAVGEADDVLIATQPSYHASGLRPGQTRRMNSVLTLPPGLSDGEYVIVTKLDTGNDLAESDETNNQATTEQTIEVALGYVDLTTQIHDNARIPSAVVSGDNTPILLPIGVTNEGNVRLPRGQRVDIHIYARPTEGGDDVLISTLDNRPVSFLPPGRTAWTAARVTLPAELEGTYSLLAEVEADGVLETVEHQDNNQAAAGKTIEVTEGFVDLSAQIHDNARIPSAVVSGDNTPILLPVGVTNQGNIRLPRGQRVDIHIYARPTEGGDDVLISTLDNRPVSFLPPGRTAWTAARVTLPAELEGEFQLVAEVHGPVGLESDDRLGNNTAIAEQTVEAAEGYVDLVAGVHSRFDLPAAVVEGDTAPQLLVAEVTNEGNIRLPRGQRVDVGVWIRPVDEDGAPAGEDIWVHTVESVPVSFLAPGQTRYAVGRFVLPSGIEPGSYQWVVVADQGNDLQEKYEDNNETAQPLQVQEYVFPWAGAWFYSGTAIESELWPYLDVDVQADRSGVTIEPAGGGEFTLHVPDGTAIRLTPEGDALVGTDVYHEPDGTGHGRIVLLPIAHEIALVGYAEGWYEDGQWLEESFGTMGLARRGGFAPNRQPLEGTYDIQYWETWIDRSGPDGIETDHGVTTAEFRMNGRDVEVFNDEINAWKTFRRRGNRWELDREAEEDGEFRSEHAHLFAGPGDTYYAISFDMWFEDASMEDLYGFEYSVVLITPHV